MNRRVFVVGDYGQLEPRLMAHFSQDPRMLAIYESRGSGDIYVDMAEGIFGESSSERRDISKTLVLAMGYGAGDKKVGAILTVNGYPTDTATGASYVAELRNIYSVFFEWRKQVMAHVKRVGFVETIGGRNRRLKAAFIDRRNWKNIGYGERQAVNAIIQGSAGDIVRRCMVNTSLDSRLQHLALLVQIHDELVWETDAFTGIGEGVSWDFTYDLLQWHGEIGHGYDLRVPLVFEPQLGDSWHKAKEGTLFELPEEYQNDTISIDYEEEIR